LSKVIVVADHEYFRLGHHALQEGLAGREPGSEFRGRIDIGIDLALQGILRGRQRLDDLGEHNVSDDHQVQVAAATLVAASH
jgi:hypothetical protein